MRYNSSAITNDYATKADLLHNMLNIRIVLSKIDYTPNKKASIGAFLSYFAVCSGL